MSTGKILSNGTLSLRFMQNAQRAKMQKQVELEQAKVKDEQEWEVSKEIKQAWGIGSSSSAEESTVHEASYVPFLFSADESEAGPSGARGRRTFNDKGQETLPQEEPEVTKAEEDELPLDDEKSKPKRITSISFKAPRSSFKDGKGARKQTAQMLIREDPLPTPSTRSFATASSAAPSGGFRRPAGVDSPAASASSARVKREPNSTPAVSGSFVRPAGVDVPAKPSAGTKLKRERDADQSPGRGGAPGGPKRKKSLKSDVLTEIA